MGREERWTARGAGCRQAARRKRGTCDAWRGPRETAALVQAGTRDRGRSARRSVLCETAAGGRGFGGSRRRVCSRARLGAAAGVGPGPKTTGGLSCALKEERSLGWFLAMLDLPRRARFGRGTSEGARIIVECATRSQGCAVRQRRTIEPISRRAVERTRGGSARGGGSHRDGWSEAFGCAPIPLRDRRGPLGRRVRAQPNSRSAGRG